MSRLKPLAIELCAQLGLLEPRIRLLNHAFNTTFAVTARDGERFALRLNVNSSRGRPEIGAEIAWIKALGEETDVWVPRPVGDVLEVYSEALRRPVFAAMYSWLPGPVANSVPRPNVARALGEATVKLHEHSRSWQVPEGCRFHPVRNIIFGASLRLKEKGYAGDVGVFEEVLERGTAALERLRIGPLQPIHYDLHFGNMKWFRNQLAVFDFDDAILGYPAMDIAVSLFYLRRYANGPELEAAYREGLGQPIEEFGFDEADCETLIAARGLGLANELYAMTTADLIALAPKYAAATETRLRHFLKTGKFDPSVATLS